MVTMKIWKRVRIWMRSTQFRRRSQHRASPVQVMLMAQVMTVIWWSRMGFGVAMLFVGRECGRWA